MHIIFEKRKSISRTTVILVPVFSFLFSLLLASILLFASGVSAPATYAAMFRGAFGDLDNIARRFALTALKDDVGQDAETKCDKSRNKDCTGDLVEFI